MLPPAQRVDLLVLIPPLEGLFALHPCRLIQAREFLGLHPVHWRLPLHSYLEMALLLITHISPFQQTLSRS